MPSANRFAYPFLVALCLVSVAQAGFFRIDQHTLTRTRLDPIASPDAVAGHVHLFTGTSAVTAGMDFASATAGQCTTSGLSADKSGYLYYKWRNGTYSAIDGGGMATYWKLDAGLQKGQRPSVVPDDFSMIAGDPNRDFVDPSLSSHKAVSFACYGGNLDQKEGPEFPDRDCPILRPQIHFPHCWNGVDAKSADNSHVAYPIGSNAEGNKCPPGFDKIIPHLFIESFYSPRDALGPEYEWYPGCFMWSNGDTSGVSMHADWQNGFPSGLLAEAAEQCPGMSFDFKTCPVLAKFDQGQKGNDCRLEANGQVVNEPIGLDVPLAALPGNNPEYSTLKSANKPKAANPNYVDTASLVSYNAQLGGGCDGRNCRDYIGPRNAPAGGNEAAPPPKPATPIKPASAPITATPSKPPSGTPTTRIPDRPKSTTYPVHNESPDKPGAGAGPGETKVCKRSRKARRRPSERR